ncbi:DNA-binding protein [Phocaeicola sartorii]|uniref:HU family DNA-binding protein n=1 Tax=Phocaeicola sartorii TaxID=671267 RepID=UPI00266F3654|nr:DNA-binding protein [Phocaeicola sartorii]
MINYSTCMRGNPTDKDAAKKAYANAQYSQVMTLDKFCHHIASHGCVYSRADIQAIIILAVDCLREQLLNGQQVQLGDLGVFSNSLRSYGAETLADFTADNITAVNVVWAAGERFNNLRQDAEFQLVPTRKAAAEVVKALKAGKTTVDLTGNSADDEEAATSAAAIAVDVAAIASSDISDASTVSADDNAEASGTAASPDGPADGNI